MTDRCVIGKKVGRKEGGLGGEEGDRKVLSKELIVFRSNKERSLYFTKGKRGKYLHICYHYLIANIR